MRNIKYAFATRGLRAWSYGIGSAALLAFMLAAPMAFSQEILPQEPKLNHLLYTSPRRIFSCEVPKGWQAFEEEALQGSSAHFLGPAVADGAFRAAINVHFMQKGSPGFITLENAVKRERQSDKDSSRDSSSIIYGRLAGNQSRRFEVTETRQLPREVLPSRPTVLHHYYVFLNAGDGYFMIKLSTTRETYLDYRPDFERLLSTFQILGAQ